MDLEFSSAEERQFRESVRAFLRSHLAPDLSAKVLGLKHLEREDVIGWQRTLHSVGWGGPSWPKEFGGTGWSSIEQHIFDEECSSAGAPPIISFGVRMVAPVIMAFGNRSQQEYFLPRILSGEHWWCRSTPSPAPGPAPASSPRGHSAGATITSSTARRPGTRSDTWRIGSSVSSGRIRSRAPRRESRSPTPST